MKRISPTNYLFFHLQTNFFCVILSYILFCAFVRTKISIQQNISVCQCQVGNNIQQKRKYCHTWQTENISEFILFLRAISFSNSVWLPCVFSEFKSISNYIKLSTSTKIFRRVSHFHLYFVYLNRWISSNWIQCINNGVIFLIIECNIMYYLNRF